MGGLVGDSTESVSTAKERKANLSPKARATPGMFLPGMYTRGGVLRRTARREAEHVETLDDEGLTKTNTSKEPAFRSSL